MSMPAESVTAIHSLDVLLDGIAGAAASDQTAVVAEVETVGGQVEDAGFGQCEYFNLSAGVVALHRGWKL